MKSRTPTSCPQSPIPKLRNCFLLLPVSMRARRCPPEACRGQGEAGELAGGTKAATQGQEHRLAWTVGELEDVSGECYALHLPLRVCVSLSLSLSLSIYIYTYTYVHVCVYTYLYTYILTHTHTHTYTSTCTFTCTCRYVYIYIDIDIDMYKYMYSHIYIYM